MAIDDDLSALLPDPPPSRPARREAAIGEALRRFDAGGKPAPRRPVEESTTPPLRGWGRPQIAVLASAALVVMVGMPVWLAEREGLAPGVSSSASEQVAAPSTRSGRTVALDLPPASVDPEAPDERAAASARPYPSLDESSAAASAQVAPAPAPVQVAVPEPPSIRQAAAPARPATDRAAEREAGELVVTGSRVARSDRESASPMVTVDAAELSDGRWTACTLRDPRRNIEACRTFANPQLTDGVAYAWAGDLDRAIGAFDRAIKAAPNLSIGYLNRGLAYQAKGDLRRALADLNRAVARDPGNRGLYYYRSELHRARGDIARADADARRAGVKP